MAYFPDKQKIKQEIQEAVNEFDLSCDHLTTANFCEPNVAYVRDNTTREKWINDGGVFARPMPIQIPVMGRAKLMLKTFYIPYRVLSPQWHNFITRSPHVPANAGTPIIVQEMPYFKMATLQSLFETTKYSTVTTGNDWDFINGSGIKYRLTAWGRHSMKILHQLRYKIYFDIKQGGTAPQTAKHWNALRILAFAKAYLDYYYSSQYAYVTSASYDVEKLFKKDANTAYELTATDFDNIFTLTRYNFYTEDYFVSQWDNPVSPNQVNTSFGVITMTDITTEGTGTTAPNVDNTLSSTNNQFGTPFLFTGTSNGGNILTQYAIDSLKMCTDYVHRYAMAGIRSIDRYLARFGVLLTAEKLQRSEYFGCQETQMQFGAVMSTAETTQANLGDYAGQGIINSDGQDHKTFEMDDIKDLGCIMQIFTIMPKIGYFQGIDRNNMRTDPESYFNGIFDALGTQATSAAELYVSPDGTNTYGAESTSDRVFGWIARGAHNKLALDNLTGDFAFRSMNNNSILSPWHMFRTFDDSYFANNNGIVHSPAFVQALDSEQYLRIFNATAEEAGDHFVVMLQFKIKSNIHAKPIYDTYDFEGKGKEIIMDGLGPKQN